MAITDVQCMLGHEDIVTTRIYAKTSAALLCWAFDRVTATAGLKGVREIDDAAALMTLDVLANRERPLSKNAGA